MTRRAGRHPRPHSVPPTPGSRCGGEKSGRQALPPWSWNPLFVSKLGANSSKQRTVTRGRPCLGLLGGVMCHAHPSGLTGCRIWDGTGDHATCPVTGAARGPPRGAWQAETDTWAAGASTMGGAPGNMSSAALLEPHPTGAGRFVQLRWSLSQ